jgi:opacity protein-like surface antigen
MVRQENSKGRTRGGSGLMRKLLAGSFLIACLAMTGATGAGAADVDVDYAAEPSGWYLAVSGGLNRVFELDYETEESDPFPFSEDGEIEFDYGFRGAAAIGKRFGGNLRAELEFAVSSTDADEVDEIDVDGSLDILSLLAKLDYEMEFFGWWHPYIGVGAGVAHVTIDDIGGADAADGDDTVFAAAIEAGSMFALTETAELFTQTQLMFLGDVEGGFESSSGSITLENPLVLSSSIGLRINF